MIFFSKVLHGQYGHIFMATCKIVRNFFPHKFLSFSLSNWFDVGTYLIWKVFQPLRSYTIYVLLSSSSSSFLSMFIQLKIKGNKEVPTSASYQVVPAGVKTFNLFFEISCNRKNCLSYLNRVGAKFEKLVWCKKIPQKKKQ